jgi:hypothetical protein
LVPEPAAMRRFLLPSRIVVEIGAVDLLLDLADAGQHSQHAGHAADALHLLELIGQVLQVEGALAHFLGDRLRLLHVDGLRGLFDQAHHVAHAEDAPGDALRMEILQRIPLLAGAEQLDGLAGHGPH